MGRTHAERVVDASPADVYAVLADYRAHHPKIMPKLFSGLEVEEGGVGAGTVFHIKAGAQVLHMRVDEPYPGRRLTETNLDTGDVTTFTVVPENGGSASRVRIGSEWATTDGLRGQAEGLFTSVMTRQVLAAQLRCLDRYLRDGYRGGDR